MAARVVAASDVGGTFTDLVVWDGTRLHTTKRPTDPGDRQAVVVAGTRDLVSDMGALVRAVHGTTAATNAIIQRRGGRVGLITNAGFEDLIEIGRQNRPSLYDLDAARPEPLVPRALRIGVPGRLDPKGRQIEPTDAQAVRKAARRLQRSGVDAVAVCLLHSYARPAHEDEVEKALQGQGIRRVSASHDVSPEFREFERMSTTVANAYLQPVFEESLQRLERGLAELGSTAPLFIVESSGGMMSAVEAQERPVRTVLSGPAGGVAAAAELARRLGIGGALTLDMGDTSTDPATLRRGRPASRTEAEVAGIPLRVPMLDLVTIGAGGGSIAHVDAGGLLAVGPQSAEAHPGPACYGRGGTHATVTDADVVLGRIHQDHFLGGTGPIRIDAAKADAALSRVGNDLGIATQAAARAVLGVATATLEGGIRQVTAGRGLDPATFTLIAYGGAGPLHGVEAAAGLGVGRVVVPRDPAVFSAWGMLVGDVHHAFSAGLVARLGPATAKKATRELTRLRREAAARIGSEGFAEKHVRFQARLDLRYEGQSYELSVPIGELTPAGVLAAADAFHRAHRRRFGHAKRDQPVQVVAVRLDARARPRPRIRPERIPAGTRRPPKAASLGARTCWFLGHGAKEAAVWDRSGLLADNRVAGPAVIEGRDHTLLVPPGAKAHVGAWGDLEVVL